MMTEQSIGPFADHDEVRRTGTEFMFLVVAVDVFQSQSRTTDDMLEFISKEKPQL